MLDLEFIQGLIHAIDDSGIDSLEITRAGTRIRVSKTPPPAPANPSPGAQPTHVYSVPQATPSGAPAAAGPSHGAASGGPAAPARDENVIEIASPMVGTFYRSPSPEAPPYVEIGSQVRKGQTLCILEAMKLMNELEAEIDGTIRGILVENTDPVEYGQPLFLIEPAK
ncbi:MAG TPA: acetyl-CoA carboxylase biotin carboxyl carrier protein [Longimicrobiales bacterium]|nr:acetyl-CoA carboxylase biotin carboxyl carrier protein [Longimicrobiales bacterium]